MQYFNSHPHEEDDVVGTFPPGTYIYFNSHPHEEDDITFLCYYKVTSYFNSHPHEEDDDTYTWIGDVKGISTHILTRRMTRYGETHEETYVFQLTSSRGG